MVKSTTVMVASLCLALSTEAFPRLAIPGGRTTRYTATTTSPIRPSHVVVRGLDERKAIIIGAHQMVPSGTQLSSVDGRQESEAWTLQEDWALMDNLRKFTVSSSTETRTFWTQLWAVNSILFSTKQPEELYKRVQELESQEIAGKTKLLQSEEERQESTRSPSFSLTFGPSPPVLENWKIETQGDWNQVVGQIRTNGSGQRTIWFHYHVIGRLEGDPFADSSSSAVTLFPGGYVEAVGGRIYELGQPMLLDDWGVDNAKSMQQHSTERKSGDATSTSTESSIFSKWWVPGSTAAISALVSSTILSACIGYGAGLAIISDSSHHHTPPPTPTMLNVETVLAGPSHNSAKLPSQSSSLTRQAATNRLGTDQTASTEELKARTEYRILREERLLRRISEKLELDKQNLKQLEEREQQEQSSSSQLRP